MVNRVVNPQFLVKVARTVAFIPGELRLLVVVKLREMALGDGVMWDTRVVREDLVVGDQVLPLDAPSDLAWDSRFGFLARRLVVHGSLLRAHLLA